MSFAPRSLSFFLCGDVMTGRGIDQILPHPNPPHLYELHAGDARDYVALAERANGSIPRPVSYTYVWGEALPELERRANSAVGGRDGNGPYVPLSHELGSAAFDVVSSCSIILQRRCRRRLSRWRRVHGLDIDRRRLR